MSAAFTTAVLAQVEPAIHRVYTYGAVPSSPTYPYLVTSAVLGMADGYTLDRRHGLRHGRIVAQAFGRTLAAASDIAEKAVERLVDRRLSVPGWECTPNEIEIDPALVADPDDDGVIGLTFTLTFTAAKEA